jgi:hypothetical protein
MVTVPVVAVPPRTVDEANETFVALIGVTVRLAVFVTLLQAALMVAVPLALVYKLVTVN